MMEALKKFRTMVFATIALFLYLFGYRSAKETAENRRMKGELNAVKKAKIAHYSLYESERLKRLHDKYKR